MSLGAVLRRCLSLVEGRREYEDLHADLEREIFELERRRPVHPWAQERRSAVEGEQFFWPEAGVELRVRRKTLTVEGRWWCISCGTAHEHQMDLDRHCGGPLLREDSCLRVELGDRGVRHVIAWRSFVSGQVEVP